MELSGLSTSLARKKEGISLSEQSHFPSRRPHCRGSSLPAVKQKVPGEISFSSGAERQSVRGIDRETSKEGLKPASEHRLPNNFLAWCSQLCLCRLLANICRLSLPFFKRALLCQTHCFQLNDPQLLSVLSVFFSLPHSPFMFFYVSTLAYFWSLTSLLYLLQGVIQDSYLPRRQIFLHLWWWSSSCSLLTHNVSLSEEILWIRFSRKEASLRHRKNEWRVVCELCVSLINSLSQPIYFIH